MTDPESGEAVSRAYERGIRLLARRDHARTELLLKLRQRGIPTRVAQAAVSRIADEGYLDDAAFARSYAQFALQHKGWAPQRIRQDLVRRGVDAATADTGIEAVFAGTDLVELATELARKRRARIDGPPEVVRRKLADFLARRGFSHSVCRSAVDDVAPY